LYNRFWSEFRMLTAVGTAAELTSKLADLAQGRNLI